MKVLFLANLISDFIRPNTTAPSSLHQHVYSEAVSLHVHVISQREVFYHDRIFPEPLSRPHDGLREDVVLRRSAQRGRALEGGCLPENQAARAE